MVAKQHRWVTSEPDIPFELSVLYEDEHIIVVDKPHFLASIPRGMWYKSTALMRLRLGFGEPDITPAHRLDRATAGVLVFVRQPSARGAYQMLFQDRKVEKVYECLAPAKPITTPRNGRVVHLNPPAPFPLQRSSRIIKRPGYLQASEVRGLTNADTTVCLNTGSKLYWPRNQSNNKMGEPYRAYRLLPKTGKTHQLRVHMASMGLPILGDHIYPVICQEMSDDYTQPLQLVARQLSFVDPYSQETMVFRSRIELSC